MKYDGVKKYSKAAANNRGHLTPEAQGKFCFDLVWFSFVWFSAMVAGNYLFFFCLVSVVGV